MKFNIQKFAPILYVMAALCILGGIALLAFAVPDAASVFFSVVIAIFAILSILLGGLIIYFLFNSRDDDINFFLYDRKTGTNIRAESLTFERINSRMTYFMSRLSPTFADVWQGDVLTAETSNFGRDDVYKPLVAYKMLYDLAELDRPEVWALFANASPETVDELCNIFEQAGESSVAQALSEAFEAAAETKDTAWVRDFLMGNVNYFRRRMTEYVKKNIEWFY